MTLRLLYVCVLLALPAVSLSQEVAAPPPVIEPTLPSESVLMNDPKLQKYESDFLNSMPNATTTAADGLHRSLCDLLPLERLVKFYLLNNTE